MTKMERIKFTKPGYYNGNYPEGSVVDVDKAFADYAMGCGDAVKAGTDDKITDLTPYIMKPRVTDAESALTTIANALSQSTRPVPEHKMPTQPYNPQGKPPEHSSAGGNPPEHAHKPEKPEPKK